MKGFPFQVWQHVGTRRASCMAHAKTREAADQFADIYRPLTCAYSKRKWHGRITIRKTTDNRPNK